MGAASSHKTAKELADRLLPLCTSYGTASEAREIPIPAYLKQQGVHEPELLRSAAHPYGLPTVEGIDQIRVQAANALYAFTAAAVAICNQHGVLWSIDNPDTVASGLQAGS